MTSTSEVEQLVRQLYSTSEPNAVAILNKQLQEIQLTHGWDLVDALLQSSTKESRFFGASTANVKVNQLGRSLEVEAVREVQNMLVGWLVRHHDQGDDAIVLRKLCSTLVAWFLLPNVGWTHCISDMSFHLLKLQDMDVLKHIQSPPPPKAMSLFITFATNLAEDAARMDHNSQLLHNCHKRVSANLADVIVLIQYMLNHGPNLTADQWEEVLKCYQAWISYAASGGQLVLDEIANLRALLRIVIQSLAAEHLCEKSTDFLVDFFNNEGSMLGKEERLQFAQLLATPWTIDRIGQLEANADDEETQLFANMVCSFAESNVQSILQQPKEYGHIIGLVHRITRTQNLSTMEEQAHLPNAIVRFWEALTSNAEGVDDVEGGFRLVGQDWLKAIEELCHATILPLEADGELRRLPREHPFSDFRFNVKDAIQTSFSTFGFVILRKLVSMAMEIHSTQSPPHCWPITEAIFNCLSGLSSSMQYYDSDDDAEDVCLSQLFESPLYQQFSDFDARVPVKLRKRAMDMIGEHNAFLARHPQNLKPAISILFNCFRYPQFAECGARSILTLCDLNRQLLWPDLGQFLDVVKQVLDSDIGDEISRKNLLAAVAAITQALPDDKARQEAVAQLITYVEEYFRRHIQQLQQAPNNETVRELKLATLDQLVAMGKSLQAPEDPIIDLNTTDKIDINSPWNVTNEEIVNFLGEVLMRSAEDGELFEAACDVVRAGYKERKAGPFVFLPQVTVDILMLNNLTSPRLDAALRLACSYVSANNSRNDRLAPAVTQILPWLSNLILSVTDISTLDPYVMHNTLDLLQRLTPKHIDHILSLSDVQIQGLYNLTILALTGADVLPKKAAAGLWLNMLDLSINYAERRTQLVVGLLNVLGRQVIHALIFNIGGNAARSHLEWLTQPYQKLIQRCMRNEIRDVPWKQWTIEALADAQFPGNGRVGDREKERFVKQLESLRGGRQMVQVVKEFWLACRGTPMAY